MTVAMAGGRHTFAFVDIVGFTAYTARRGDAAAADLATRFSERLRALLPAHGAEEVKTLGDGMLIRSDCPRAALRLATRLAADASSGELPQMRIGVETGPAVERSGDWYGATVNRAARLCAAARPGQVLVGGETRAAVDDMVALRRRRFARLRGEVYAVRAARVRVCPAAMLRALVCPHHAAQQRTA